MPKIIPGRWDDLDIEIAFVVCKQLLDMPFVLYYGLQFLYDISTSVGLLL